jgi:hypothetical protein
MDLQVILDLEGYEVSELRGRFLLVDNVGEFVDSSHETMDALEAYVRKYIEPWMAPESIF